MDTTDTLDQDYVLPEFDTSGTDVCTSSEAPQTSTVNLSEGLVYVLAAVDGAPFRDAREMLTRIKASDKVLPRIPAKQRARFVTLLDRYIAHSDDAGNGRFRFSDVPGLRLNSDDVQELHARISATKPNTGDSAQKLWSDLAATAQVGASRMSALELVQAIDERRAERELVDTFRQIVTPSIVTRDPNREGLGTAAETLLRAAAAPTIKGLRYSCGLPALDLAFIKPGNAPGMVAPGEYVLIAGRTGTGKTSFCNATIAGFAQDIVNQGLGDQYIVLFHTEEESEAKIIGAGLAPGGRAHHLADRVIVKDVGTSRVKIVEKLYDIVAEANIKAVQTGRSITDFLPAIVYLDYLGSIVEIGETETEATFRTAELMLRGVCAWNFDEMAKWGGVSYSDYTGDPVPDGMGHHRVTSLVFGQFVKFDESKAYFRDEKTHNLADFSQPVENPNAPGWHRDDTGEWQWSEKAVDGYSDRYEWPVYMNSLVIMGKDRIRGSGAVANNANLVLELHRSLPNHNGVVVGPDGKQHLWNTEARAIVHKARDGGTKYVPLDFDIDPDGSGKARHLDLASEQAMHKGLLPYETDGSWAHPGNAILPKRPKRSQFSACRY